MEKYNVGRDVKGEPCKTVRNSPLRKRRELTDTLKAGLALTVALGVYVWASTSDYEVEQMEKEFSTPTHQEIYNK